MLAYRCAECGDKIEGYPLHSISLNGTRRWANFDTFRCLAFWAVKQTDGTDLLDLRYLAHGTNDDGEWSKVAKPFR